MTITIYSGVEASADAERPKWVAAPGSLVPEQDTDRQTDAERLPLADPSMEVVQAASMPSPLMDMNDNIVKNSMAPPASTAPSFADRLIATDQSDKTAVPVTNDAFLNAVFGELPAGLRPFVLSMMGNPSRRRDWTGMSWAPGMDMSDGNRNWYFTLGMFGPDPTGEFHRRKLQSKLLYGVMLDDIGTKAVPRERLDACPPSWLIETSPGNYQAGYLFAEPLSDQARADTLQKAIIDAGMCDPGADGPFTRWSRLPVAINGKHSPPFACRLVEWHPGRRYTVDEIVDGLGLVMPVPAPRRGRARSEAAGRASDAEIADIYVPRSAENGVVSALRECGLYKAALGSGKHDITCPFVHEHTDAVDGGTAYFEPNDRYPLGGFKCMHSHGANLRISQLLEFLGIDRQGARHRPMIRVTPGEMHRIVDAAERELTSTGQYYQRGGLIVSVVTDPGSGETQIKPVTVSSLVRVLSSCTTWERYDERAGKFKVIDPPTRHVGMLFEADTYAHLPALDGIARQPYLRPDGSLMCRTGFDHATRMFGVFDERAFSVPDTPTRADAEAALQALLDLLREFPFASAA